MSTLSEAIDAIDSDAPPRKPQQKRSQPPAKPRSGSGPALASTTTTTASSTSSTSFESRVRNMVANDFRSDLHSRTQAHAALKRRAVGSFFLRAATEAPASETRVCFALSHFDKSHGIGHMLIYAHAGDSGDVIFSTHANRDAGSQFSSLRDLLHRYHFPENCKCGWRPLADAGSGATIVPMSPASPRDASTTSPRHPDTDVSEPGVHFRGEFARSDAEAWLASQQPGSYVVRPSQERRDAFTVSLRERPGGLLMHVGISRSTTGTWSIDGVSQPPFASLKQLLSSMPHRLIVTPISTSPPPVAASALPSVTPPKPSSATKPRPRGLVRGVTELSLESPPPAAAAVETNLYTRPPANAAAGTGVARQRKLSRATSHFAMSPPPNSNASTRQLPAVVDEPMGGGYTRPEANRTAAWQQQQQQQPPNNQYQQLSLAPKLPYTTLAPEQ